MVTMPFRLAVVLPMYNEAGNVVGLLERIEAVRNRSGLDLTALAVDDGSRDGTFDRLIGSAARFGFLRFVRHGHNRGIAAALRTGIATALSERGPGYDALAFMDADLTHDPDDLPRSVHDVFVRRVPMKEVLQSVEANGWVGR